MKIDERDFPFIALPVASHYALAIDAHGVQNEVTAYLAKLDDVRGADTPWRKVADVDDEITGFDIHGDFAYLLTHRNASRFKVLRVDLRTADLTHATVVIPAGDAVITTIAAAADGLYLQKLDGGLGRLWRLPYEGGAATEISLPFDGAIYDIDRIRPQPASSFASSSCTQSPRFLPLDHRRPEVLSDTKIIRHLPPTFPPSDIRRSQSESLRWRARPPSDHSSPRSQNGRFHPTLLHGYGSYGSPYDPNFDPTSPAWLECGWRVLAVAHVRGGGENGEDWHRTPAAIKLPSKTPIDRHFAGRAEHPRLLSATPRLRILAAKGTSACGIIIGAPSLSVPNLFAVRPPQRSGCPTICAPNCRSNLTRQHSRVRHRQSNEQISIIC